MGKSSNVCRPLVSFRITFARCYAPFVSASSESSVRDSSWSECRLCAPYLVATVVSPFVFHSEVRREGVLPFVSPASRGWVRVAVVLSKVVGLAPRWVVVCATVTFVCECLLVVLLVSPQVCRSRVLAVSEVSGFSRPVLGGVDVFPIFDWRRYRFVGFSCLCRF